MKKTAVILCGSGYLDGSEIRESVGTLWALSQLPVEAQCFAPDSNQADVVDHLTQKPTQSARNMLAESARIARGQVLALSALDPKEWDAVIIPGGYGAAKTLCSFATQGSKGKVLPELSRVLRGMHELSKPIGAICIAPAILALEFQGAGFELTVGSPCEASLEIEKLGHKHVVCAADQCHVDASHRIVTTPAYMCDSAPIHQIFSGIQKLVTQVHRLS